SQKRYRVAVNVARPDIYLRVLKQIPGLEVITDAGMSDTQANVNADDEARSHITFTIVGVGSQRPGVPAEGNLLLVSPENGPLIVGEEIHVQSGEWTHPVLDGLDLK